MDIATNHVELLWQFRKNQESLADESWLTAVLAPHCKITRMHWRGSRLRIIQFPNEFARWLIHMAKRKVTSYLEIGTSTGGAWMAADAYLRTTVPFYLGSVGYDQTAKLRDFDFYKSEVGTIEFRNQNSRHMDLGSEQYGASFIDARHLERWVWHDYKKVAENSMLIGFHDIVLEGSTVAPAWARIKARHHEWREIIDESAPVSARCGIGVVDTEAGDA